MDGLAYGPALTDRVAALVPAGVDAIIDAAVSGSLSYLVAIAGDPSLVVTIADTTNAEKLGVACCVGGRTAKSYSQRLSWRRPVAR